MATDPEIIRIAVQRCVDYIRTLSDGYPTDIPHQPSEDERAARNGRVRTLSDEMEKLGQRALIDDVRFPEFDELRHRLAALGAHLKPDDISAVAAAFMLTGRLDGKK